MKRLPSLFAAFLLYAAVLLSNGLWTVAANAQALQDNFGREFYVAFGSNQGFEENQQQETENKIELYLTSRVPAKGRVTVAALNIDIPFATTPGKITTVELPNGNQQGPTMELRQVETVIKGMAARIVSDSEVAVFGMNHKKYSCDAFMALPVDVLGTEYRVMSYQSSQPGTGAALPGEFWVVGVEDQTNVTITPKATTSMGRPAGVPFNITLNKGEVYLVHGVQDEMGNDLTGSLIESDRAIAVFGGHMRTEIPEGATNENSNNPSRDHLVEQLPPVSAWGDSAIVVPYYTSERPDLVRIVSAEENNRIAINGVVVTTLNAGEHYDIEKLAGVTQISGTNPLLVGQYMHTSRRSNGANPAPYGDPALALVFPVEQFTNSYTIVNVVDDRAFTGNFVNLVVESAGVASMTLDGAPIPSSEFKQVPGTGYYYAQLTVEQGTHNLLGDKPFGVTVYALGPVASYAYTGGTLTKTITPLKTTDLVIDFRDRPLRADLSGYWDTTVYLKNISTEPITIYDFPRRTQDITKFRVTEPVTPHTLTAGFTDSMTIRFEPLEANRRMQTQITAKTDHLRAYVVDVYGRGVLDAPFTYADSLATRKIDTIDFGIFAAADPVKDTIAFLANLGSASSVIELLSLTGANAASFALTGVNLERLPVTPPVEIEKESGAPLTLGLRFTPSAPNGVRVARLEYESASGFKRSLVLLARIETIEPPTALGAEFDSILVCKPTERSVQIRNTNDVPLKVEKVEITGMNPNDFVLLTPMPLTVAAKNSGFIRVLFSPTALGYRTALATMTFSLPKGYKQSAPLAGFSRTIDVNYALAKNVHVLTGDAFTLPIYLKPGARVEDDPQNFGVAGYTVRLKYDPSHIEDVDVDQENTLSWNGYFTIDGEAGDRIIRFRNTGGKLTPPYPFLPGTQLPLLYVRFTSTLADADRSTFTRTVDVESSIEFDQLRIGDAPIDPGCMTLSNVSTGVVLDATCAPARLVKGVEIPEELYLAHNSPNPFNPSTTIEFGVPANPGSTNNPEVRLEVFDASGRLVRVVQQGELKPGFYDARFDATGLPSGAYTARLSSLGVSRSRRMILAK